MNIADRSFSAGELSSAFYARTDLAKYLIGLRQCRNFVVLREGGVTYRPGMVYVATSADPAHESRLLKFVFNIHDACVLEFGDYTMRVYQNGGVVQSGGGPLVVPTPYAIAAVQTLNVVQSGDVLTFVHLDYPPYELTRTSPTSWAFAPISFAPSIAAPTGLLATGTPSASDHAWQYAVTAIDATTGEESYADAPPTFHFLKDPSSTDPHEVVWNPVAGAVSYNVYVGIDLGSLGYLATVTAAAGGTTFFNRGQVSADFTTTPPQPFLDFATPDHYPSVVFYYQQRLGFAGSRAHPARVWCSRSGAYHNFTKTTPITDDGPIVFTMVSDEIDAIQHALNLGKLIIGTEGAEWLVDGDANGVLTPAQVNDRVGSYNGATDLKPLKVDNNVLYQQAMGGKILELKTNILYGYYTFQNADVTLMSSHLLKGLTITDWDYAEQPNYTVWAVRSDGALLSLTYLPDQQVVAWARHDTDGWVEHVCVVPEADANGILESAVYFTVRRLINGVTTRYVERLRSLNLFDYTADPVFMDCAVEYDGRDLGDTLGITFTLSG